MSNGARKFAQDIGYSFASLSIAALCHFVLRVFLGRYLGADALGLYTLSFTVYSLGMLFSGFGLGPALIKYVAQFKEDTSRVNTLVSSGSLTSFISGVIIAIILVTAAGPLANHFFDMPELGRLLRIVAGVFPFIGLQKAVLGFLTGLRRMRLFALINIVQSSLIMILTLALVRAGYGVSGAVLSLVAPVIMLSLLSVIIIRKPLAATSLRQYKNAMKMLLTFGGYVILASTIDTIQKYTSTILIGFYMTATDVGFYSAAAILSEGMSMIPGAVQIITTPVMSSFYGKGEVKKIEELINRSMKYTADILIPISFLLAFLSKVIISLFFGREFIPAVLPFQILLIGGLYAGIPTSISTALGSTAYVKMLFRISGIVLVENVVLNVLCIPRLGILGAAIAASVTMISEATICLFFIQRLVGVKIHFMQFIKIFVFTGIMAGITYALSLIVNLYIILPISVIVLVYVLLRFFNSRDDLKLVKSIIGKG